MANQPAEDQNQEPSQETAEDLEQNTDVNKASGPLSIELNGMTFDSPEDFRAQYKELIESSNEEGAEEAKILRTQYAQIFQEKMEMIKGRIRQAEKSIKKTFKFKRKPENKRSKMGAIDILQSFLDEGLLIREKGGQFSTPEALTLASPLAIAANEQIELINKINNIRYNRMNGFDHFDKYMGFVYQLRETTDNLTGQPAYEVYNLITIHGKPSIEERTYSEHETPNLIRLDLAKMKLRLNEKKKEDKKRARKTKNKKASPKKLGEKSEKKVEAKKPKNTMNEDVKVLSDAIKENPKELKIINQAFGAMMHKQGRVAGIQVTPEQLEIIIRTAVDHIEIDEESEIGIDIRDTLSKEEAKDLFVDTPKRLGDLVKMGLSADSLPGVAQSIREQLERIKASQASEESQEIAEVSELPSAEDKKEENAA